MVGAPGSTVIISVSTSDRMVGTSNTGTGTMVAPWSRLASHPALYPNMWKNGLTMR